MTDYERGFLAMILETASIHHESKGEGRRRVCVEISHRNEELMARVARVLGVNPPLAKEKGEPKAGIDWRQTIYRVRVRGLRAEALLEAMLEDLTESTRDRAEEALAGAR